jgi:hypothetical protein
MSKLMRAARFGLLMMCVVSAGCATYRTPGGPVSLTGIQSADIEELMSREAAAGFPASLSFARVQSPMYWSNSAQTYGTGQFSVVLTREFMLDEQINDVQNWSGVKAVAPLNRLLLPTQLTSIDDLRVASASLKTDVLLVFTVDTTFRVDGKSVGPLTLISLGFFRDHETVVTSTASAILVDVRSGFVYGVAEASASETKQTSIWSSGSAVDQSRLVTERSAFDGLLQELKKTWADIVSEHG